MNVAVVRKHQIALAKEVLRHFEDCRTLMRKRHKVIATDLGFPIQIALHALRWNAPQRLVAVEVFELLPARAAQFPGPHGCQREEAHCEARDASGIFVFDIAQHLRERRQIGDSGLVAPPG
ncbi:MAG: hypothetical protein JWL66_979 [Sphingomonadales bacterium]|nr:hypothetical protein [Sphingomonadales bacterium]